MFPAHAGMNRIATEILSSSVYVSRTRGDEPIVIDYGESEG